MDYFCSLGAASAGNFYLENSFSQYSVNSWDSSYTSSSLSFSSSSSFSSSRRTRRKRRRREVALAPQPITSEYFTNVALKMKAKPGTNDSLIFLSTNSLGTEFVRVDVSLKLGSYILAFTPFSPLFIFIYS